MLNDSSIDPFLELYTHVDPSNSKEIERWNGIHWSKHGVNCFSICFSLGFLEDWPENQFHFFIGSARGEDLFFDLYGLKNSKVSNLPYQSILYN